MSSGDTQLKIVTLWQTNIAVENSICLDNLPIKMVIYQFATLVSRRLTAIGLRQTNSILHQF